MTREEVKVEFAGLTHDHLMVNKRDATECDANMFSNNQNKNQSLENQNIPPALSTIAILRRHPMYDSLVLVKRYRACLDGYTLEFPTSDVSSKKSQSAKQDCCKTKLVSVYLDGDDPIYQCQERKSKSGLLSPEGEMVHVPMNGLLDRLDRYDRQGVSIDSRVYAFAMGMKTAQQFLTTSSIKELQETPPL